MSDPIVEALLEDLEARFKKIPQFIEVRVVGGEEGVVLALGEAIN